eukprot:CAMPEP_0169113834 /NCGR_PEP_ID=MMETSP1015-20121227/28421_1 /TAXON_ID=342587 /ORGANISM="Karlodinium micrum, Strain CCMP2283" /LENGTH=36 /DNA_ID= /DNA_START= /DNA_END= /DNA_ORIENTATION=
MQLRVLGEPTRRGDHCSPDPQAQRRTTSESHENVAA